MQARGSSIFTALVVVIVPIAAAAAGAPGGLAGPETPTALARAPDDVATAPSCSDALLPGAILLDLDHNRLAACGGIRPGAPLVIPAGPLSLMYCTMAFVVTDGTDLYVATAGHCTDPDLGVPYPRVFGHGVGAFGTVVHRWCEKGEDAVVNKLVRDLTGVELASCGLGFDFSLIKVDADKRGLVNPAMCHWGAPLGGLFTAHDGDLRSVQHFGWGMFLGEATGLVVTVGNPATQARQGVGVDFTDSNVAWVQTPAISGDSGSAILVSAGGLDPLDADPAPQALGVITHITNAGTFVQRLDKSLEHAAGEMGRTFSVVAS